MNKYIVKEFRPIVKANKQTGVKIAYLREAGKPFIKADLISHLEKHWFGKLLDLSQKQAIARSLNRYPEGICLSDYNVVIVPLNP